MIRKMAKKTIRPTEDQKRAAEEWLDMMEAGDLVDERPNHMNFHEKIMKRLLGHDDTKYEYMGIDFTVISADDSGQLAVETKGTKTDLDARQNRPKKEHTTPMIQLWDHMGKGHGYAWGMCTNYRMFRLVSKDKSRNDYYEIDFKEIRTDPVTLSEFIYVFRSIILDGGADVYKTATKYEKDFANEFYRLFRDTRRMLIREFEQAGVKREESVDAAQTFLNRLMFLFFAEDRDLLEDTLFLEMVRYALDKDFLSADTDIICKKILGLFDALDKGYPIHRVFGFNGGLFKERINEKATFKDYRSASWFGNVAHDAKKSKNKPVHEFVRKHALLSPIISNLLEMRQYNFNTEVDVNILGHIFEQSISELEKFQDSELNERRREGIYYTPNDITDFICRSTILPYLSLSGSAQKPDDLVREYVDKGALAKLELRLLSLKLLDPACGSGAFLVEAADTLLDVYRKVHDVKITNMAYYSDKEQTILTEWSASETIRRIIKNNIYGVDKNLHSVKITQLAMFLKTAAFKEKLPEMSDHIIQGNSLVDSGVTDAVNWNKTFPDVFDSGGFDIIIGNPPYGAKVDYPLPAFKTAQTHDTYAYFTEVSLGLLKPGGRIGYIIPVPSMSIASMISLQSILLDSCSELKISNYDDRPGKLFEGIPHCRSSIVLGTKNKSKERQCSVYTTGYNRWNSADRKDLFTNIRYEQVNFTSSLPCTKNGIPRAFSSMGTIPKLGNVTERGIIIKILQKPPLKQHICKSSNHAVYYHDSPQYWIRAMTVHKFSEAVGASTHVKSVCLRDQKTATVVLALLNSSLFYWFFIKTSNCRDLIRREIFNMPIDIDGFVSADVSNLEALIQQLMSNYKESSKIGKDNRQTGITQYEKIYPRHGKTVIDEIDGVFAVHYGLSASEATYIKTFDEKFRLGLMS